MIYIYLSSFPFRVGCVVESLLMFIEIHRFFVGRLYRVQEGLEIQKSGCHMNMKKIDDL